MSVVGFQKHEENRIVAKELQNLRRVRKEPPNVLENRNSPKRPGALWTLRTKSVPVNLDALDRLVTPASPESLSFILHHTILLRLHGKTSAYAHSIPVSQTQNESVVLPKRQPICTHSPQRAGQTQSLSNPHCVRLRERKEEEEIARDSECELLDCVRYLHGHEHGAACLDVAPGRF